MAKGKNTKETIKRQALCLFVTKGVDGTGVREIAKASGITEGAIYRHFKGKDDLVLSLFEDNYAMYAKKLDALQTAEQDLAAKLAAMVRGFCQFYDQDETLFQFLLLVQHGQLEKISDDTPSPVVVFERVLADGFACGALKPTIAIDATQSTAWIFGIVLQTATFKIYGRLKGPMIDRADALIAACYGALGLSKT